MYVGNVFVMKFLCLYVFCVISILHAADNLDHDPYESTCKLIWGDVHANGDERLAKRNDDAFQRICDLYEGHMLVAAPFQESVRERPELYAQDKSFYLTPVFGFLTDFWGRPMYDHAALLCEYYDEGSQKIVTNLYHLTMRNDWKLSELIRRGGYGYWGYAIQEEGVDKIVELMMCHPKYKGKYVRYHPYKTFKVSKTEEGIKALEKVKELSQEPNYSYSLYGSKSANQDDFKGSHNCISFIIDALWQFGVFQENQTLHSVLAYRKAYPLEPKSPYSGLHKMTKRLIRVPESLKHLIDNPVMIKSDCVFKVHPSAEMKNYRPLRERKAYAVVNDMLKWNIVNALHARNGITGVEHASFHNASDSIEPAEEFKDDDFVCKGARNEQVCQDSK